MNGRTPPQTPKTSSLPQQESNFTSEGAPPPAVPAAKPAEKAKARKRAPRSVGQ